MRNQKNTVRTANIVFFTISTNWYLPTTNYQKRYRDRRKTHQK